MMIGWDDGVNAYTRLMTLRRTILAIGLVVLAGLMALISFGSSISGEGQLVLLISAAYTLAAAGVLFARRWLGSFLALLAGGVGVLLGGILSGLAGLGSEPAPPEVLATFYLGAAIGVLAAVDLVLMAFARRSEDA
jgi:hypothetical protein